MKVKSYLIENAEQTQANREKQKFIIASFWSYRKMFTCQNIQCICQDTCPLNGDQKGPHAKLSCTRVEVWQFSLLMKAEDKLNTQESHPYFPLTTLNEHME